MDTQGKVVKLVNSKLVISKSSSSSTKSIGVITRSMPKKLKDSSQITPLTEHVQKDLDSHSHEMMEISLLRPLPPMSSYSFTTNVTPIIVKNATTIEEQLASLTRAIEGLTKHVQEQDAQIARLINKAYNVDTSHIMGKQVEAHDETEYPESNIILRMISLQISSDGLIPVDQLIEGTIRSKIEGSLKSSLTCSKPYTPRIDNLKMPMGYQLPKWMDHFHTTKYEWHRRMKN
ncbi:UNVERIFIED_CONTAM: hypothetical protein Slati_0194300 [Sesamum latifolium]|uniref:Uncharacterized protein n=1 Tax=Sesamum latifolium TaxID=2727402 RepID=A0AAW2YBA4_9LAMI